MKKLISVFLCIVMLLGSTGIASFASEKSSGTNYPYVFVHGMMG